MPFSADDPCSGVLGFYVQAGPRCGFGHLSRALALAEACARTGREIRFYSENDLRAARFFQSAPFRFTRLKNQAALGMELRRDGVGSLVVDHPGRNEKLLEEWSGEVDRLVVIDDWDADCAPADLLVNGHVLWNDRVVRKRRQVRLMGLRFALLKPHWAGARARYRFRRKVRRVLLTFGGSDPQDMAGRLVPLLARRFEGVQFISILGPGYRGRLRSARGVPGNVRTVRNAVSLAPLALQSDAAVSAVGVTMYELASTGVPTVLVDQTPAHAIFMDAMESQGLALRARDEDSVAGRLEELIRSASLRKRIGRAGRRRLDARGVERVASFLNRPVEIGGHA